MKPWDKYQAKPWEKYSQPEEKKDISLAESLASIPLSMANIPSSARKIAGDLGYLAMNPIDTVKGMGGLLRGGVEKLIPDEINGVDFGPHPTEQIPDAVGEYFKDRYGSFDKARQTGITDPLGTAGDTLGVLTGGGVLKNAAAIPARAGARMLPEDLPANLYESAVKFRTTLPKKERQANVKTALDEGISPTGKGLEKAQEAIDKLDNEINSIVDIATNNGGVFPKKALYKHLREARAKLGGVKANAPRDLKILDSYIKQLDMHLKKSNKNYLTPRELQDFKTNAYKAIDFDRSNQKSVMAKEEALKSMAKSAKELVEEINPNIKDLNKRQGKLISLKKNLEQPANRIDNRDMLGIGAPIKVGAGTAAGSPEAGLALAALDNPTLKPRLAIAIHKMRNKGLLDAYLGPQLAYQGLFQGGRINDDVIKGLLEP